jgi:hypothetical protein
MDATLKHMYILVVENSEYRLTRSTRSTNTVCHTPSTRYKVLYIQVTDASVVGVKFCVQRIYYIVDCSCMLGIDDDSRLVMCTCVI